MQAAKQKEQQEKENSGMNTASPGKNKPEFKQKISFKVEEHNVVKQMRPMVKEIVNKMKEHAAQLSQF